jgi:hypothetical protein
MRFRPVLSSVAVAAIIATGGHSIALAQITTEDQVKAKLESQGYHDIRDVKFGPEGITLRATKDGQDRALTMDSSGKVIERQ